MEKRGWGVRGPYIPERRQHLVRKGEKEKGGEGRRPSTKGVERGEISCLRREKKAAVSISHLITGEGRGGNDENSLAFPIPRLWFRGEDYLLYYP